LMMNIKLHTTLSAPRHSKTYSAGDVCKAHKA
jgi:hypothetical protein